MAVEIDLPRCIGQAALCGGPIGPSPEGMNRARGLCSLCSEKSRSLIRGANRRDPRDA